MCKESKGTIGKVRKVISHALKATHPESLFGEGMPIKHLSHTAYLVRKPQTIKDNIGCVRKVREH